MKTIILKTQGSGDLFSGWTPIEIYSWVKYWYLSGYSVLFEYF